MAGAEEETNPGTSLPASSLSAVPSSTQGSPESLIAGSSSVLPSEKRVCIGGLLGRGGGRPMAVTFIYFSELYFSQWPTRPQVICLTSPHHRAFALAVVFACEGLPPISAWLNSSPVSSPCSNAASSTKLTLTAPFKFVTRLPSLCSGPLTPPFLYFLQHILPASVL